MADFLLRKRGEPGPSSDGYESAASTASSVAGDDADAISLVDDYVGRNNKRGSKRAVRLDEIGPRMELRLIKIVEGTPGKEGSVIYHEFGTFNLTRCLLFLFLNAFCARRVVKKSKAEAAAQKAEHVAKEKLRKQRRDEQEKNVQRKKAEAESKKDGKKKAGDEEDEDDGMDEDEEEDQEEGDEDDNWDDEEEISEDEEADDSDVLGSDEDDSDSEAESEKPPPKKPKKSRR